MTTLFIFRRSLRLSDNKGLIHALKSIKQPILPIFILTPEQLSNNQNKYKSDNCVQFMMESLRELNDDLKTKNSRLRLFYGKPKMVLDYLLKKLKSINVVVANMDYTPYAIKRDQSLCEVCQKYGVEFVLKEDYLLQPIGSVLTGSGNIYTKYTPYWRQVSKKSVDKPLNITGTSKNYWPSRKTIAKEFKINSLHKFYKQNNDLLHNGGRKNGIKQLKLVKCQNIPPGYNTGRDQLNRKTTELSAYIKFGCVSIREVYWHFKNTLKNNSKDLIKELYWREFYMNVTWGYPRVLEGQLNPKRSINKSLKTQYDKIKWRTGKKAKDDFILWCKGQTGFPIVDAAMTQMNTTGFMHNRCRMIVSSFLIKTLLLDWRLGEQYFAKTLYDYDPSSNNGGWGFISSGGSDAQPYFRIFNPWSQSKKHDPNCEYIKHWLPELKDIPNKDIHKWNELCGDYLDNGIDYYEPMVDYSLQRKKALDMYKKVV
jgi:deoxyribodipyrimidine photo-lyase